MSLETVRVLVFPCGSEIGLEIIRSLRDVRGIELFGASSVESNHGPYVLRRYRAGLPFVDAPDFLEKFNALLREWRIDLVFPAHDDVVLRLAEARGGLEAEVAAPDAAVCAVCRSKRRTHEVFSEKLPMPQLYEPGAVTAFPVFLKPDRGQGSRGVWKCADQAELAVFLRRDPSLLVMEHLPGPEHTVDCFTDAEGRLLHVLPRERVRVMNGIAVDTRPAPHRDPFGHMARIIQDALPMRGAWFFQVKEDGNGRPALLEIAPRVGGSMGLSRALGVNLPLLTVLDRMGGVAGEPRPLAVSARMDRALECRFRTGLEFGAVLVDVETALLDGDRASPWVMAFLCQCKNNRLPVAAVAADPERARGRMDALGLSSWLGDARRPGQVSAPSGSLLLTSDPELESFGRGHGFTVLPPNAVDVLLDWRV